MKLLLIIVIAMATVFSGPGFADENTKRALAKAQYILRQTNAEKVELQKSFQEAKKEISGLESKIKDLKSELGRADQRIGKLKDNNGLWQEEYAVLKEKLQSTREKLARSSRYGEIQDERFAIQTENFKMCMQNNQKLANINGKLLGAYENKTAMDALKQRDPFFGLKKVEVENLVQDFRYRIEDLNLNINDFLIKDPGEAASDLKVAPVEVGEHAEAVSAGNNPEVGAENNGAEG